VIEGLHAAVVERNLDELPSDERIARVGELAQLFALTTEVLLSQLDHVSSIWHSAQKARQPLAEVLAELRSLRAAVGRCGPTTRSALWMAIVARDTWPPDWAERIKSDLDGLIAACEAGTSVGKYVPIAKARRAEAPMRAVIIHLIRFWENEKQEMVKAPRSGHIDKWAGNQGCDFVRAAVGLVTGRNVGAATVGRVSKDIKPSQQSAFRSYLKRQA
jgi:hypothetical protein